MGEPSWADQVIAWASVITAIATVALVLMALFAWSVAKATLEASKRASEAATRSAEAATAANEQSRLDSIAQTRPYVYAEIVPSVAGVRHWDIKITNTGRSAALDLTLDHDAWPAEPDDVARSVIQLFTTPRALPPGSSIRAMWRLEGNFTDGTTEAGLGKSGTISVTYGSSDRAAPTYTDRFDVMIENSGLWPVAEEGPNPNGLTGDALKFYRLGQILVRKVGDLGR